MFDAMVAAATNLIDRQDKKRAAKREREFNAQQAEVNRNFQAEMSNTAHQRQVEDLKAAGLNPILSANSGASTPGGSQASASQPKTPENLLVNANNAAALKQQLQLNKFSAKVGVPAAVLNTKAGQIAIAAHVAKQAGSKIMQSASNNSGYMRPQARVNKYVQGNANSGLQWKNATAFASGLLDKILPDAMKPPGIKGAHRNFMMRNVKK
jgi:hypothetical protein